MGPLDSAAKAILHEVPEDLAGLAPLLAGRRIRRAKADDTVLPAFSLTALRRGARRRRRPPPSGGPAGAPPGVGAAPHRGPGQALQALVDPGAADFAWASVLGSLGAVESRDLTDPLELVADAASHLDGARRHALAGQVLEAAEAASSRLPGDLHERFAIDLVVRLTGGP